MGLDSPQRRGRAARARSAPAGVPGRRTPRLPKTADTLPRYGSVSYSIRLSCLHRAGARVATPNLPPPPPPAPKPGSPARRAIWLERRPGRDPYRPRSLLLPPRRFGCRGGVWEIPLALNEGAQQKIGRRGIVQIRRRGKIRRPPRGTLRPARPRPGGARARAKIAPSDAPLERSAALIPQSAVVRLRHVAPSAVKGRGLPRLSGRGCESPSLRWRKQGGGGDPRAPLLAPRRCSRPGDCGENSASPARAVLPRTGELVRPSSARHRPNIGAGEGAGTPARRGASHPSRFSGPGLADIRRPCGARIAAEPWISATAVGVGVRHSPKWGSNPAPPRSRGPRPLCPSGGSGVTNSRLTKTADTVPRYGSVSYSIRPSCLHRAGARVATPNLPPPPARPEAGLPSSTCYLARASTGARPLPPPFIAPPAAPIRLSRWSVGNTARPKRGRAAGDLARRSRPDSSPRGARRPSCRDLRPARPRRDGARARAKTAPSCAAWSALRR